MPQPPVFRQQVSTASNSDSTEWGTHLILWKGDDYKLGKVNASSTTDALLVNCPLYCYTCRSVHRKVSGDNAGINLSRVSSCLV